MRKTRIACASCLVARERDTPRAPTAGMPMPMRRAEPDRARVKRRAACFIDNEGVCALDAERCRRRVGVIFVRRVSPPRPE